MPMKSSELFRNNIKRLMKERGLKVKELAEMAGLSPSYFSLILSGERENLSDYHKDALALALDVSVSSLYMPLDEEVSDVTTAPEPQEAGHVGSRETHGLQEPVDVRDTGAFEDFLNSLNLTDPYLVAAFYREVNTLTDAEVRRLGSVLRNTIARWQASKAAAKGETMEQEGRALIPEHQLGVPERRVGAVLGSLAGIFREVPLEYLEAATALPVQCVLRALESLSTAGIASLVPTSSGDGVVRLSERVPASVLKTWVPLEPRREALCSLARYLEEKYPDTDPDILAQLYLDAQDLSKARTWYRASAEKSLSLGWWRVAKERLKVVLSLDAVLRTDPDQRSVAYQMMVTVCSNLGDLEEALVYQERNLSYWERTSKRRDLVMGLSVAGGLYSRLGMPEKAQEALEKALRASEGDTGLTARARIDLAYLLLKKGQLTNAQAEFEEALSEATKLRDQSLMAHALLGLGRAFYRKGELGRSVTSLNRALALSEGRDTSTEAWTRLQIAKVRFREGAYAEALRQLELVKAFSRGLSDRERECLAEAWAVRCALRLQENGEDLLERARAAWTSLHALGDEEGRVVSSVALGEAEARFGSVVAANRHFAEAIRDSRLFSDPFLEGLACEAYGEHLYSQGDDLAGVMLERGRWARSKIT